MYKIGALVKYRNQPEGAAFGIVVGEDGSNLKVNWIAAPERLYFRRNHPDYDALLCREGFTVVGEVDYGER